MRLTSQDDYEDSETRVDMTVIGTMKAVMVTSTCMPHLQYVHLTQKLLPERKSIYYSMDGLMIQAHWRHLPNARKSTVTTNPSPNCRVIKFLLTQHICNPNLNRNPT